MSIKIFDKTIIVSIWTDLNCKKLLEKIIELVVAPLTDKYTRHHKHTLRSVAMLQAKISNLN